MEYLLLSVITLLILKVSGDVEISFMKEAPRLNNSMYYDYYFACHAEGETLRWIVNNNNVSDYFGQSVGQVFTGSISTCNYTTTLPSLKQISPGQSIFDSILIISCGSKIDYIVACTNGSVSRMSSSSEKTLISMAENNIPSVNLEHVLNENLFTAESSSCTNIFVCGVNHIFMDWEIQGKMITFTTFDNVGVERRLSLHDTTVQAILIGFEPYSLVVAMIVIGSAEINVICGYPHNTTNFTSISCPTNLETTELETSTVGESSTTLTSGGENNLPLIVGLIVSLGAVIVAVIIIIILGFFYHKRSATPKPVEPLQQTLQDETDSVEIPLRDNNFSGIKKPKKRIDNIEYSKFFKRVHYIFLTRSEITFNAATTFLSAPDIERKTNVSTCIDEGVYIGMIGSYPVCFVNEIGNHFLERLKNVIIQYFPNAKYLVFVGRCFGIDPEKSNLADIVISKSINHVTVGKSYTDLIAPEIRSMFCFYPDEVEGLKVTENRTAKHFVAKIASGVNIFDNENCRNSVLTGDDIFGCEETSGKLLNLYRNGINMGNNTTKYMQVITIDTVTGYLDGDTVKECDEWQFVGSQAALHYVASKMKCPHATGNISYEIKKPKPKKENINYKELAERVKYIILTIGPDEFEAVVAYITAQNFEENIIKIFDDVYIGMIGAHSVGLLYSYNAKKHYTDMKNAIVKHFPHSNYLIHVGGCVGVDQSETKLGDVLISKEIFNINNDGASYHRSVINMTPEIQHIFCNSEDVEGLELPGNRTAKHFEVRIATGTGADIDKDERMKKIAIETRGNYGYDEIGGEIALLQCKMSTFIEKKIHFILVNGVCCYKYSNDYDEWDFVASQAAIHYVASKIQMH